VNDVSVDVSGSCRTVSDEVSAILSAAVVSACVVRWWLWWVAVLLKKLQLFVSVAVSDAAFVRPVLTMQNSHLHSRYSEKLINFFLLILLSIQLFPIFPGITLQLDHDAHDTNHEHSWTFYNYKPATFSKASTLWIHVQLLSTCKKIPSNVELYMYMFYMSPVWTAF